MAIELGIWEGSDTPRTDQAPTKGCKNSKKGGTEDGKGGDPLPAGEVKEGFQEEEGLA